MLDRPRFCVIHGLIIEREEITKHKKHVILPNQRNTLKGFAKSHIVSKKRKKKTNIVLRNTSSVEIL